MQSNRQIWSWSTKWSRAGLTEFSQENTLVIETLFSKNRRDSSTHGHHQMVNTKITLTMFFAAEDWEALYSQKNIRPGADYGSDHEFLTAKFRLKLKKVGKATRSFRYDLNKVPYDYTVEVMNRLKELELIVCLKNYEQRFITLYRRQWLKPSPRKRNAIRQNSCLRKLYK